MVQRAYMMMVDDLDGTQATQTVTFGVDGVTYQIDVNDEHADQLRSQLAEYVSHARRVGGRRIAGTHTDHRLAAQVRAWAKEHQVAVANRGRIPNTIVDMYRKATTNHTDTVTDSPEHDEAYDESQNVSDQTDQDQSNYETDSIDDQGFEDQAA